jgi:hypothetical protein
VPPLERTDPQFTALLGDAIVALSRYFCGVPGDKIPAPGGMLLGRDKIDPIYIDITERRDGPGPERRAKYSSCGDQLHAILERIGVRESWVNRASRSNYVVGANIVRLREPACPCARPPLPREAYRPPPGSLCLIWTTGLDAHALVVLGPGSDSRHILTGNYGAGGMSAAISPGSNVADSPIIWDGRNLRVGASRRILQRVITPASLVPYIKAPIDLSGAAVTGELVDALGAVYA